MFSTTKIFLFSLFFLLSSQIYAVDPVYKGYFSDEGVSGYDVVAYFKEAKPVKGKNKFKTTYNDAEWLFSTAENLKAFKANPKKYAPQYGGYCAYGLANGSTVSANPLYWTILHNKLYLNYDQSVYETWKKDTNTYIAKADKIWKEKFKFKNLN